MTNNPPLNSKFLYMPLREVQIYLNNLEIENEKLKSELTTFSRFNCILENIRRSSSKGLNALQLIDRNKSCVCNEHLNPHLRRIAQESDIELRVWQEQYEKLIQSSKKDYMATHEDNIRLASLSPRSSTGNSSPVHSVQSPGMESEPESTMSLNSNTNDSNYRRNQSPVMTRTASISLDNTNDSGFRSDCSDKSDQNINKQTINNGAVARYISQIRQNRQTVTEETVNSRSTPLVVYESRKEGRLTCDWPNCNRVFFNEDILTHHRRNHIRKSIYSCEYCSTRLLSKEELDNHMKKHVLKPEPESDKEEDEPELIIEEDEEMPVNGQNRDNSPEAVNLTNKSILAATLTSSVNNIHCNNNINININNNNNNKNPFDKTPLSYQTVLYERLTSNHKSTPPPPAINTGLLLSDHQKISPQSRTDDYKRTRYSGVGRYRCPWPDCGYTPHFLRDLRRHMYKHTGDKKHKCDYPGCDFVSVWKTSLLQHQRKKHFNGSVNPINTADNMFNKFSV